MKTLFLSFALLMSTLGFAQDTTGHSITVTVENFLTNDGKAVISLHTSETFMRGPGLQNLDANIVDGKATFTFKNVQSGEYALLVLHDKNGNNQMDFEDNGMPKEAYGTSNSPRSFGPPNYDEAKFKLEKDVELSIRL
ncbi:Uncharacterized conserved protein, DUF2141 family [Formosa sp. Hel1_31_208]|uniref:DUF2141 domain-containing protein n=1 Tax=Formosa sp. Hel1_31_208 TaxID=1798225 RepID=UPI00087CF5AA|nr:DUF2141 domain-containing protein [Formosa sp. Hel1_31_208]SDS61856.1 Uncharacterized conserved protein, DUF2141 family [Formosa sp. Hel1_31_208]